jgi:hypothetical protein
MVRIIICRWKSTRARHIFGLLHSLSPLGIIYKLDARESDYILTRGFFDEVPRGDYERKSESSSISKAMSA